MKVLINMTFFDDEFTNPIVVFTGENAAYEFIKPILKDYEYCKKVPKNILTKIWL